MATKTMWLTRDDNYCDNDYQLFHYRDHPKLFTGSYCSTAKSGLRMPWKRFSTEDWENNVGMKLRPGTKRKIRIRGA